MGMQSVYTPDGKVTPLFTDWSVSDEVRQACVRVCVAYGAVDVLPMLGVDE